MATAERLRVRPQQNADVAATGGGNNGIVACFAPPVAARLQAAWRALCVPR